MNTPFFSGTSPVLAKPAVNHRKAPKCRSKVTDEKDPLWRGKGWHAPVSLACSIVVSIDTAWHHRNWRNLWGGSDELEIACTFVDSAAQQP